MADPWGAIGSEVWRSKKFRPLSDIERTAYVYCHASPHRNPIGLFRLPIPVMADDMDRGPNECRAALQKLTAVGLIDYDDDEAYVRIRNWEKRNAPEGPQEAIGRMQNGYDKAPDHILTIMAFVAFAQNILHKAAGTARGGDGWKISDARSKMEDMIFHRLKAWARADMDNLAEAFDRSKVDPRDRVFDILWHMVSDTQSIPSTILDRYTDTDKDHDKDHDHDRDKDTDRDRDNARGREARKRVAPEIEAEIRSLNDKSKGKKS